MGQQPQAFWIARQAGARITDYAGGDDYLFGRQIYRLHAGTFTEDFKQKNDDYGRQEQYALLMGACRITGMFPNRSCCIMR